MHGISFQETTCGHKIDAAPHCTREEARELLGALREEYQRLSPLARYQVQLILVLARKQQEQSEISRESPEGGTYS
jgi:hypothetical protein